MDAVRDRIKRQQAELDRLGRTKGWRRGRFGSWTVNGYTVALANTGMPREILALRGNERHVCKDLAEVLEVTAPRADRRSRSTVPPA